MWNYTWDAENRLASMQLKSAPNVPIMQLVFAYDHLGRRIRKASQTTLQSAEHYENTATQYSWSTSYDHRYLYQGPSEWLLGATMLFDEEGNFFDQQVYAWGVDLSDSEQGAGGIGGLILFQDNDGGGPMVPLYDSNGNLTHLYDRAGEKQAEYQYGPFGEVRGQTRTAAAKNPFRFSTKFTDNESGLVYYGYRYYSPSVGRWISRDPIEERDGPNVMAFVRNRPVGAVDALGLRRRVFLFGGYGEHLPKFANVARVVRETWLPFLRRLYPEDDITYRAWGAWSSTVEDAVPRLRQKDTDDPCKYSTVIVAGFSYGAVSALQFAQKLDIDYNIRVDLLFMVDPVVKNTGSFGDAPKNGYNKTKGISVAVNYYQTLAPMPLFGDKYLRGIQIAGADVNENRNDDYDGVAKYHYGYFVKNPDQPDGPRVRVDGDRESGSHVAIALSKYVLEQLRDRTSYGLVPKNRDDYRAR